MTACNKQLDVHHTTRAFLKPIPQLPSTPGVYLNILCIDWTFAMTLARPMQPDALLLGYAKQ